MPMSIHEEIDDLFEQIKVKEKSIKEKDEVINKLLDKVQELQAICFEYSEAGYAMLGALADNLSLTPIETLASQQLKAIIDKNLSADEYGEDYKTYLTDKYINKDGKGHAELIAQANEKIKQLESAVSASNNHFIEDMLLDGRYKEDDTETFKIKEK